MKFRLFFPIICLVLLFPGLLFSQGTTLTVFSGNGEKFTLFLNGEQKNSKPGDYVRVDYLYGPSFKVRVAFADPAMREISKTVFNKPGGSIYYLLKPGKKGEYVFESTNSDTGWKGDGEITVEPKAVPQKTSQSTTKTITGNAGCDTPMPEADFLVSAAAISNAPFDGPRLSSAKKLVTTHCLSCDQIVEVIYLMNDEGSRLTIAKEAYIHCYDPSGYDKVREALSTQKSKDDLNRHIESLKQK